MSIKKGKETSVHAGGSVVEQGIATEHDGSGVNPKSGRKVAGLVSGLSKGDSRFWLQPGKLFKWKGSATYSFRVQFRGLRLTFPTNTSNRDAAARIAAGIFNDLVNLGVEAGLVKHKGAGQSEIITLGQWIEAAGSVFDGSPATFTQYSQAARHIAADLLGLKRTSKRWGRKGGDYTAAANAAPLSLFSAKAVQTWRLGYVAARGSDPAKSRAARISCNSILRSAKALFGEKVRKFLPAIEGEIPFANVEFYGRESMRYQSKIDAGILLAKAREELAEARPEEFKALLLLLCAGLRRGEVDRLLWRQIDLDAGLIHVEVTEAGGLKSEDSAGEVAIDKTLCGILRGFKAKARGQFYLEGREVPSGAVSWGQKYRCKETFESLVLWLRAAGVEGHRPLHTLRKEAGAMVASRDGIYAASRFLRHADIAVTSAHYADTKTRVMIPLGGLLPAENIEPFPSGKESEEKPKQKTRKKKSA
jgi:integrase